MSALTLAQLADRLGLDWQETTTLLRSLAEEKQAEEIGADLWRLTPETEQRFGAALRSLTLLGEDAEDTPELRPRRTTADVLRCSRCGLPLGDDGRVRLLVPPSWTADDLRERRFGQLRLRDAVCTGCRERGDDDD